MNTPTITKPAAAAQLPSIPFTRAALPQVQPGNVDVSTVMLWRLLGDAAQRYVAFY